jgi:anti-sigma-K factor RskA
VTDSAHDDWRQLAVGHALDALEPADEAAFARHLAGCAECQDVVAETAATMAELAYAVTPAQAPAGLRDRILAAANADRRAKGRPRADSAPRITRRRPPRWPHPMQLAVAASVMLLAVIAAGVWTLVAQGHHEPDIAARCAAVSCPTAPLTAAGRTVADVMLLDDHAYVRPVALAGAGADHTYVLWRIGPNHRPIAVGAFSARGGHAIADAGSLGVPAGDVRELAISLEPGRTAPAVPSDVVATGGIAG